MAADVSSAVFRPLAGRGAPRLAGGRLEPPAGARRADCGRVLPRGARLAALTPHGRERRPAGRRRTGGGGIRCGTAPGWSHWQVYVAVTDADLNVRRAVGLGGQVLDGPEETPYGRAARLADPRGGRFSVIEVG
ncbi:VOC family protein [Streptomyces sp. NPDC014991]|uniref:VOC family protein n=1 Tax=Streptomyces sp. NPDC014991 TaxID=3364935 RepID=UPI003700EAA8